MTEQRSLNLHTCFASDSRQAISMQAVTVMLYIESGTSPLTFDEFSQASISCPEEGVKLTPPNPMRFTE